MRASFLATSMGALVFLARPDGVGKGGHAGSGSERNIRSINRGRHNRQHYLLTCSHIHSGETGQPVAVRRVRVSPFAVLVIALSRYCRVMAPSWT